MYVPIDITFIVCRHDTNKYMLVLRYYSNIKNNKIQISFLSSTSFTFTFYTITVGNHMMKHPFTTTIVVVIAIILQSSFLSTKAFHVSSSFPLVSVVELAPSIVHSHRVSSSLSKTMLHLRLSDSAKGGTPSSSNDNNDDTLSIIQQQQILEQQEKLLEQQELILRQQVSRSTSSAASSIPNSIIQSNNINNGNNSNKAMDPLFASMTRIDPTSSELNEGPVTNVPGIGEVPTSQVKFLAAPLVRFFQKVFSLHFFTLQNLIIFCYKTIFC